MIKCKIREDIRRYNEKIIADILEENVSTRKVKRELSLGKYITISVKDEDGNNNYSREGIIEIATEFYENLYRREEEQIISEGELKVEKIDVPEILNTEAEAAIRKWKNNKASRPGRITNEIIKFCMEAVIKALKIIFNETPEMNEIPEEWKTAKIILLHKKGARDKIENYRPMGGMRWRTAHQ